MSIPEPSSSIFEKLPESGSPIRLLTLFPARASEPIVCALHVTLLGQGPQPEYQGLSYAWGREGDESYITVNGQPFAVRNNLMSALEHLRYTDRPRTLWIDAICINQSDLDERSQQVSQMYLVYALAERVVIWVGSGSATSPRAMELLRQANDWISGVSEPPTNSIIHPKYPRWEGNNENIEEMYEADPNRGASEEALGKFFERSWFRRVWVVQEAASAPALTLKCGREEVHDLDLLHVWRNVYLAVDDVLMRFKVWSGVIIEPIYMLRDRISKRLTLLDDPDFIRYLLEEFQMLVATDPRDHIFVIVSLARHDAFGTGSFPVQVDYNRDIALLFTETMEILLNAQQSLSLLALAGDETNEYLRPEIQIKGLPSWVPDWSHASRPHSLTRNSHIRQAPYNACENLRSRLPSSEKPWYINKNRLHASALLIGEVVDVGVALHFDVRNNMERCHRIFDDAYDIAKRMGRVKGSGVPEDFVRTLAANRNKQRQPLEQTIDPNVRRYSDLDESIAGGINRMTVARVLVVLHNGTLGLAPRKTQKGDKLYVVPDCPVAVVLREVLEEEANGLRAMNVEEEENGRDGKFCRLIGAAYANGLMDGEIDQTYEHNVPNNWHWEDVTII